ncbi:Tetratricopeptide repeat-containing protein [Reichenbachiella agariperforans]|uniref:Tetratricopeptide repeat-containing protein n=1 Tax=Reichenbachiella agariperforans TaxID=156994 RepID=A0A1M6NS83_REIAG|nr:Tetratricopeptide repeat-containing protein [Reichenbachiella agariperforans]
MFSQNIDVDSLRKAYLHQLDTTVDFSAQSKIYYQLSDTYTFESDSLQEFYLKKSYQSALKGNNEIREMLAASQLSSLKRWQGAYDSALFFLNKAETIVNRQSDGLRKTRALTGMMSNYGKIFQDIGDYEKAIQYLLKAIDYAEDENLGYNKAMAMMNIGSNYLAMNDDQEAEEYFRRSLQYADTINNLQLQSWNYQYIGTIYAKREMLDSTLNYYRKAINISKADPTSSYREVLVLISEVFVEKASYDSALTYLNEAKLYYDGTNKTFQIKYLLLLSKISYNRGQMITAKNQAKQAYLLAQKDEKARIEILRHQVDVFRKTGEYEKALNKKDELSALKNKFLNEEKIKAIKNLEIKYETEKLKGEKAVAENQIKIAEAESEKNRSLFIASVIGTFLIIISAMFYFSKLKQAKKAELIKLELIASQKQLALEKQYRDSELKALKAQMNPHFIFNVLNSIQEFIILNKKDLASDYLSMFAELIRSYLHFSNSGSISLRDEVDTLEKYLELETLRFEDTFSYDLQVDEGIYPEEFQIPTMIIQPYVENAIKHGLFHKSGDRKLTVAFTKPETDLIQCIITDNGIGRANAKKRNEAKGNTHKSFAMEAIASRLELYNEKSKNKIGIETLDLLGDNQEALGTQVILTIPLI